MPRVPAVYGIDPGLSGGMALLTLDGKCLCPWPLPVVKAAGKSDLDAGALADTIVGFRQEYEIVLAAVELVHAMPKQGVTACFTFGKCYGKILGVLESLRVPYELVRPQAWQKAVLAGLPPAKDTKTAAVAYVTRRFPGASLRATARSRVAHDGMADAACIAEYARRLAQGK